MLVKSQVKYIQSLGHKKHRDEYNLFIAEGPKIVNELLTSMPSQIREIYAVPSYVSPNPLISVIPVTEDELAKISQLQTPNQVLAILEKPASNTPVIKDELCLALDTIQDPGNLGTIIRIADWFGIKQIVCSNDCADVYNPKVVQSTMGSIARVKLHYVDLEDWLKQQQTPLYAAVLDGTPLPEVSPTKNGILIIGNESKGISPEIQKLVKFKVTIPRIGQAESLNAAVATAIIVTRLTS